MFNLIQKFLNTIDSISSKNFKTMYMVITFLLIILTLIVFTSNTDFYFFSTLGNNFRRMKQYNIFKINYLYIFISIIYAFTPCFLIKFEPWKPSIILIILLYNLVYIPVEILTPFMDAKFNFDIFSFNTMIFICFCFMIHSLNDDLKLKWFNRYSLTVNQFILLILGLQIILFLIVVLSVKFNFPIPENLITQSTNPQRLINRDLVSTPLVKYPFNILSNWLNPILLILALHYKRPFIILYILISHTYIYLISLSKTTFLIIPFLLIIYLMMKRSYKIVLLSVIGYLLVMHILAITIHFNFNNYSVHRFMHIHAILTHYYIEFFKGDNIRFFSDIDLISKIFNLPKVDFSIPQFVGKYSFYKNEQTYANENFWATAYANFGLIGVVIETLIITCLFKLFDTFALYKNKSLLSILIFFPAFALTSSGSLSVMVSGCLLLSMLVAMLLPQNYYK